MANNLNILIIGGSSFVAKNYIKFNKRNDTIYTVSRTATGFINEFIVSDFNNISENIFENKDVVINCAAIVHQNKKIEESIYNKINFELAIKFAQQAKKSGAKMFVQLSTVAVYGRANHINISSKEKPITPYGKSKLLADNELLAMSDKSFNTIILRPPMVYGGGNTPGNMMRLIRLISTKVPLPFKGITNQRDFIQIKNLIRFMEASIEKEQNGIFLVSDNSPVSINDLYNYITNVLDIPNRSFKLPTLLLDVIKKMIPNTYEKLFGSLTIDISNTIQVLNVYPEDLIIEGLKEMKLQIQ